MKGHVDARWGKALLICKKCGKKLHGGFGPKRRTDLAKALREATGGGRKRKAPVGIVETGCLGICPKGAVTMVDGSRPGEWLLVRAGTPIEDVVERLGLATND